MLCIGCTSPGRDCVDAQMGNQSAEFRAPTMGTFVHLETPHNIVSHGSNFLQILQFEHNPSNVDKLYQRG